MAKTKLDVTTLLMPKATTVWLVENTALTFKQIADFTGIHHVEVQALADGDVGRGIAGRNPVDHGEIEQEELDKAAKDDTYVMKQAKRSSDLPAVKLRSKGPKYTPVGKRGDKPDAIAYILKHHPEVSEAQICKLVGTTKPTIGRVRDRTIPNASSIKPRHPVDLGLCTYAELEASSNKGLKAQGKTEEEIKAHKEKILDNQEQKKSATPASEPTAAETFDFSNFMSSPASTNTNTNADSDTGTDV